MWKLFLGPINVTTANGYKLELILGEKKRVFCRFRAVGFRPINEGSVSF